MRKLLVLLSFMIICSTTFFTSTSLASEKNKNEFTPYSHDDIFEDKFTNLSDEASNIIHSQIKNEKNGEPEYLTEKEVLDIDFYELTKIREKLNNIIESGEYTEAELNKIIAKEIKDSLENKAHTLNDYEIPGFGKLNDAEIALAKKHPIEFANYGATAVLAKNEAEKYYGPSQLYQGNGDAFRHSYWNALMVTYFGGSVNGPKHGYDRAKVWATAHEATSSGIDKEMDLYNNEQGRYLGWTEYTSTSTQFSTRLRALVKQGALVRIVNNKLTATNGVTGK